MSRPSAARRDRDDSPSAGRADLLRGVGTASVLIDDGALADQVVHLNLQVERVFDLVGNSALRDSLRIARPGGRVCQLGFLGGLEPVAEFNPIADVPTGVQFSFYGSAFVLGTESFPLSRHPAAGDDHQGGERAVTGPSP